MQLSPSGINETVKNQINKHKVFPDLRKSTCRESPNQKTYLNVKNAKIRYREGTAGALWRSVSKNKVQLVF